MTNYLTEQQVNTMLQGLSEKRVSKRDGMSYVESYDTRRVLISTFGFGRWSGDVLDMDLLYEDIHEVDRSGQKKQVVSVGYRARYRLTVNAPDGTQLATYTEAAAGDASNFPMSKRGDAHDFAMKSAESQALKRCAVNLGDYVGALCLYNNGSTMPIVRYVLGPDPAKLTEQGVMRPEKDGATQVRTDEHLTEQLAPENPPNTVDRPPQVKASDLDAKQAAARGVSVEQERADRLAEAKVRRDALGVDSSGKVKASERTNITRDTGPLQDDPWAGRADPHQETLT